MTTITDGATTLTPTTIAGYGSARESRNVLHTLLGSSGQAVTLLPTGLRSGTLTAVFPSIATAQALETMLKQNLIFTLADAGFPGVGMTFVLKGGGVLAVNLDPQSLSAWLVVFDYQEV